MEEGKPVISQAETEALDFQDRAAPIIDHIVNQFEESDILGETRGAFRRSGPSMKSHISSAQIDYLRAYLRDNNSTRYSTISILQSGLLHKSILDIIL